jgi:RNA polymerase sigma-70 factor (ECF subfamily)
MENIGLGNINGRNPKESYKTPNIEIITKERGLTQEQKAEKIFTFRDKSIALATQILKDYTEASDIVSEATLKALEHLDKFKHESTLETWFHRIVSNTALDFLRKNKNNGDQVSSNEIFESGDEKFEMPDPSNNPEESVIKKEEIKLLNSAIATLPKKYHDVVINTVMKEISDEKMVRKMHIPTTTIRTIRRRGIEKLREIISQLKNKPN